MISIETFISDVINNPSEENKEKYLNYVLESEHKLLKESNIFPYKSKEYFNARKKAFSFRRECAMKMISEWVKVYKTTENCVVSYADTLIIPFQQIKPIS